MAKSVHEIHHVLEGDEDKHGQPTHVSFTSVLVQIAVLDIIFSLDSVITAVGMVNQLWVMITAIVLAIGVMVAFASKIGEFVHRHPTLKMLALSFLILIGVMLMSGKVHAWMDDYFARLRAGAFELAGDEGAAAPGGGQAEPLA